ncbi:hypothetical protein PRUPE_1G010900 [Prunus persica]|uniref:Uncharacterized protein n=1 Tax=Prunus persica TaxID=3760 RepID=A0A251QQZ3_PRUPE|nr:hypothetical protein PRUPE_1G010900 [Prunus persica]
MHREEPPKSSGKDFVIFPRVKCKEIVQSILICCLTFCVQRVVHNAGFSYINGHGLLHGCISKRTKASAPSLI